MAAATTPSRLAKADNNIFPLFEDWFTCNYHVITCYDKAKKSKLQADENEYEQRRSESDEARIQCETAVRERERNLNEYQQLIVALMTPMCYYLGYDKRTPLQNAENVTQLSSDEQQRVKNVLKYYAEEKPSMRTLRLARLKYDHFVWLFKIEELLQTSTLQHLNHRALLPAREVGGLDHLTEAGEVAAAAEALTVLKYQPEVIDVDGFPFYISMTGAAFAPIDLCTSAMHSLAIASTQATSAGWSSLKNVFEGNTTI